MEDFSHRCDDDRDRRRSCCNSRTITARIFFRGKISKNTPFSDFLRGRKPSNWWPVQKQASDINACVLRSYLGRATVGGFSAAPQKIGSSERMIDVFLPFFSFLGTEFTPVALSRNWRPQEKIGPKSE